MNVDVMRNFIIKRSRALCQRKSFASCMLMAFTVASVSKAAVNAAHSLGFALKQEQLEVVVQFVLGKDVFAVLPTGYGKTLCYQCLPRVFNIVNA